MSCQKEWPRRLTYGLDCFNSFYLGGFAPNLLVASERIPMGQMVELDKVEWRMEGVGKNGF